MIQFKKKLHSKSVLLVLLFLIVATTGFLRQENKDTTRQLNVREERHSTDRRQRTFAENLPNRNTERQNSDKYRISEQLYDRRSFRTGTVSDVNDNRRTSRFARPAGSRNYEDSIQRQDTSRNHNRSERRIVHTNVRSQPEKNYSRERRFNEVSRENQEARSRERYSTADLSRSDSTRQLRDTRDNVDTRYTQQRKNYPHKDNYERRDTRQTRNLNIQSTRQTYREDFQRRDNARIANHRQDLRERRTEVPMSKRNTQQRENINIQSRSRNYESRNTERFANHHQGLPGRSNERNTSKIRQIVAAIPRRDSTRQTRVISNNSDRRDAHKIGNIQSRHQIEPVMSRSEPVQQLSNSERRKNRNLPSMRQTKKDNSERRDTERHRLFGSDDNTNTCGSSQRHSFMKTIPARGLASMVSSTVPMSDRRGVMFGRDIDSTDTLYRLKEYAEPRPDLISISNGNSTVMSKNILAKKSLSSQNIDVNNSSILDMERNDLATQTIKGEIVSDFKSLAKFNHEENADYNVWANAAKIVLCIYLVGQVLASTSKMHKLGFYSSISTVNSAKEKIH